MLPEILAMPHNPNGYSAINIDGQIVVRQGLWQGCTLDVDAWEIISAQWLKHNQNADQSENQNADTDKPSEITDTFSIDAYSTLPHCAENLPLNVKTEELPLALMAQQLKGNFFNLLQGDFKPKKTTSAFKQTWLWAVVFMGCALLVNLGVKGVKIMELNAQTDRINEKIIQTYKVAFPKTKRVKINTIRSQLKRELGKIGASGDQQSGFLPMLMLIRPAFSDVPELKPDSLKFEGKREELRIQATASDYKYFESFKGIIDKTSLTIVPGSQNNNENGVSGSFIITAASADKNKRKGK
jgi:general secretion pathway protein L